MMIEAVGEEGGLEHLVELSRHIERSAQQPGLELRGEESLGSLGREESWAGSLRGESSGGSASRLPGEESTSSLKHWVQSPTSEDTATLTVQGTKTAGKRRSPHKRPRPSAAGSNIKNKGKPSHSGRQPRDTSPPPRGWEALSPRSGTPSPGPSEFLPEWWWQKHECAIARIVTTHWLAFTRARRAMRHRRLSSSRRAWREWRQRVAATRRKLRSAIIWDHRRLYLFYGRCFQLWLVHVRRQSARRRAYIQLLHLRARHLYVACLQAWLQYGTQQALKRQRYDRAWGVYARQLYVRAVAGWKEFMQAMLEEREQVAVALQHWARKTRQAAVSQWVRAVALIQEERTASNAAYCHAAAALCSRVLLAWRRLIADLAEDRAGAISLLQSVDHQVGRAMFADALQLWLALCRRRAELRRVEALLIGKTSVRRQRAALCAWQGEIKYIQLLDGARAALSRVAERVWLSWVLADWREALRVDELDKGRQARWKVVAAIVVRTWRAWAREKASVHAWRRERLHSAAMIKRQRVLSSWQQAAHDSKERKQLLIEALELYMFRLCQHVMREWRLIAAESANEARMEETAFRHWADGVQVCILNAWGSLLKRRSRRKLAYVHAAKQILRRAIGVWRDYAGGKAARELDRRRAVRHRYFSLLGRALAAWLAEITPNPDRMALWAHIRMVAASMLLSEVWLAWADEFVPACVAEREAACRAAVHWRAARLRVCLRRWHATAEECVHERDACLRARSFHERRVRRHCLMGWCHWAATKIDRREERMERAASARAALNRLRLSRLLSAWVEITSDEAMQRFQEARAVGYHSRRLLGVTWTALSVFVVRRRWKHQRQSTAEASARRRLGRLAIASFVRALELAALKRGRLALSVRHWSVQAQRLAWRAWRRYWDSRLAKRRRMEEALALYALRLQREGAGQWMRVAEWRRQHRFSTAVQSQMQEARKKLVLVEPFARRWRARAAERAAARREGGVVGSVKDDDGWQVLMRRRRLATPSLSSIINVAASDERQQSRRPPWAGLSLTRPIDSFARPDEPSANPPCLQTSRDEPRRKTAGSAPRPHLGDTFPAPQRRWPINESPQRMQSAVDVAGAALPVWRASHSLALGGLSRPSSRPKPRIPSLLFDDDDGGPSAPAQPSWQSSQAAGGEQRGPPQPRAQPGVPHAPSSSRDTSSDVRWRGVEGAAEGVPNQFVLNARMHLRQVDHPTAGWAPASAEKEQPRAQVAPAAAENWNQFDGVALSHPPLFGATPTAPPLRERNVARNEDVMSAVAAEMADMEGALRDFQLLRQEAAELTKQQESGAFSQSAKQRLDDLQAEIQRRKPRIRLVAQRIKELKATGAT